MRLRTPGFRTVILPVVVAAASVLSMVVHDAARPRDSLAVPAASAVSGRPKEVTVDQLREAVLAPDDLGPGFGIVDESARDDPPEVFRALLRLGADAPNIIINLMADPSADPAMLADAVARDLPAGSSLEDVLVSDRVAAEWLAPGAVAYHFTGLLAARRIHGNFYIWRHGVIRVSVMVTIRTDDAEQARTSAERYAELQRDRLSAVCSPCAL
jgi:hypothetical protein